ncbi:NlpC/P60 family protein [Actinospica robiniae]|uniref:C40 family peptidase n=1 Tax=Actinospica robiniae TaxID=304901 RepID=UPI0003F901AB|nr:NlpC/P60 family protein [Actinospica robiniae]
MQLRRALAGAAAVGVLISAPLYAAVPAAAATGFPAETALDGRDGPSLNANVVKVDMYAQGQTVNVVCQAYGEEAYGSTIWDKTTDNVWVPDFYVKTGASGYAPGVPRCNDTSGDVHEFPATSDLDGRQTPSLSGVVVQVNEYLSGSEVPVVCQATGGSAYGSTIWDETSDGVWVTDVYVKTGASGFAPGVPRCTTTSAPSESGYLAETDLNGRATTSVSAPAVKVYPSGSTIYVTCQAIGENAYGSNIWDKTTDGLWVADYYVKTGYSSFIPGMAQCAGNSSGSGGGYVAETDLDGRSTKSLSAAAVKTYPSGSTIDITCQAYGQYAYGSYIWDKTTDGLWVTDYYVKTGSSGFISDMPRCDNDAPSGGPTGGGTPGGGTCDSAGHGRISGPQGSTAGTAAQKIQRVIALAQHETTLGLSYAWGAGGPGGPSCGIASKSPGGYVDYNIYGFDCSGFTEYLFWAAGGVDIGDNTNVQDGRGTTVPYSSIQPGDLIFWGPQNSSGPTGASDHVALYIGNGQMIEAAPPRGTDSVHVTNVYGEHAYAIRIFS